MKNNRSCMKWVVVAVSAFATLALIGLCTFAFLYVSQQARAREGKEEFGLREGVPDNTHHPLKYRAVMLEFVQAASG